MMTNDGNEMETIETELKIGHVSKSKILQNRVKTYDFVAISRVHANLLRFYNDFSCFSMLIWIWIE